VTGYQRSTLKLKFDDPDLDGLEVRVKRMPIGDLLAVSTLSELGGAIAEMSEQLDTLLDTLSDALLSWNLEDAKGVTMSTLKGEPAHNVTNPDGSVRRVRSTGLYSVDIDLILSIVEGWMQAAAGVSRPLPQSSSSGEQSPAAFELMAAASLSQPS
jgi:hypothetical protein